MKIVQSLTCGIALLALAACASDPAPVARTVADKDAPLNLDVASIDVLDRSGPALADSPYNVNNFQPTLAAATRSWATQKLKAAGPAGQAIVTITDASLKEVPLPHEDSWIDRPQASKYVAHIAVEVNAASPRAGQGHVAAEASRYETLPEEPTSIERQNAYTRILNGIMRDLSVKLRSGAQARMTPFVINAPILPQTAPN